MKNIVLMLMLAGYASFAQIKGNNIVETRIFPFVNVETIKIEMYAKITIDNSATEGLEITAENNLFDYIDTEIVDGTIILNQKKWIQSTQEIIIKIGAPKVKRVVHGTNDTTLITNVNNDELRVNASIGQVILDGKTSELRLGTETGRIDATKLVADKVYVNLWDSGTVKVNPTEYLWADVSNDGKLFYTKLPKDNKIKTKSGGVAMSASSYKIKKNDIKWITFQINNNSDNRNHFVVRGPKADGSSFGYGFPMMPNTKRKETWSVGTKIYKQTTLGFKKLLVEIKAEDEGKVVNLF